MTPIFSSSSPPSTARRFSEPDQSSVVVDELIQSLEKRGDSGARVRTYGMRFTAYFPYLILAIAYHHLGQLDTALQALETEERLDAIAESAEGRAELTALRMAQKVGERQETERIQSIVRTSLSEAAALQREGGLEEALEALGNALAVAPDDPRVRSAGSRLRQSAARQDKERSALERRQSIENRARGLLEQGDFSGASSLLRGALAPQESEALRVLLEDVQQGLRSGWARQNLPRSRGYVACAMN